MSDEFDQTLAIDDDGAVTALALFFDARPLRHAWRNDPEKAPRERPVYAREPDSIRIIIAMRDDDGWVSISRDGEVLPLTSVASWAPLAAAVA